MLSKINYQNIIESFWIGIIIGLCFMFSLHILQYHGNTTPIVLASGGLGLVVGAISEFITSFVLVSIAKAKNYFIFSGLIGTLVTITTLFVIQLSTNLFIQPLQFRIGVGFIILIIIIANVIDFYHHKKTKHSLRVFYNPIEN